MLAPSAVCLAFGQLVAACSFVQLSVARERGREGGEGRVSLDDATGIVARGFYLLDYWALGVRR